MKMFNSLFINLLAAISIYGPPGRAQPSAECDKYLYNTGDTVKLTVKGMSAGGDPLKVILKDISVTGEPVSGKFAFMICPECKKSFPAKP